MGLNKSSSPDDSRTRTLKMTDLRHPVVLGCLALLVLSLTFTVIGLAWRTRVTLQQTSLAYQTQAKRDVLRMTRDMGQLLQSTSLPLKTLLDTSALSTQRARTQTLTLQTTLRNTVWLRSLSLVNARGQIIISTNADNIGTLLNIQDGLAYGASSDDVPRIGTSHAGHDLADGLALTDNAKATPSQGYLTLTQTHLDHDSTPLSLVATLSLDYLIRQLTDTVDTLDTPPPRVSLLRQDGLRLLDTQPADARLLQLERDLSENWQHGTATTAQELEAVDGSIWIVATSLHNRLPIGLIWAADRDLLLAASRAQLNQQNFHAVLLVLGLDILIILTWLSFHHANRRTRQALRRNETRQRLLEKAIETCVDAILVTRPDGSIEWGNPAFSTLTGFSSEEATNHTPGELIKSGLQPVAFYHQMWQSILNGHVWRGELVNRKKNGNLYNESLTITPILDADGKVQHFIAIKEDITERKLIQEQIETAHTRLLAVVENFPGGLIMEDVNGDILFVNAYLFELFGIASSADFAIGKPRYPLTRAVSLLTENEAAFVERTEELRTRTRSMYNEEIRLKDGRWIERDFVPIHHQDTPLGYLCIYRDISPRKRHERELWQLATTDPLTGLLNRRAFFEQMEHERSRLIRYQGEAAILMLDIDYFKHVNDTYGHAAGDAMLCHIVTLTHDLLRESDTFGRLGGEEFAILMPSTLRDGALRLGERIRATLELRPLHYNDSQISVTTSIGISIMSAEDTNTDQALSRADHALYAAKRLGRNRVEIG
jgi:diguanylate cyclase (GGDEF)-like protein/PAS domain S-box-containing protein